MKIIFSMLLSSNSLLLLFVIAEFFIGKAFSQKSKYLILKVALLFSIIPLGELKNLITAAINYYSPSLSSSLELSISGRIQTLVITPTGYFINKNYRNDLLFFGVWFFVTFIIFIVCLRKQYCFRKHILNTVLESFAPDMLNILKKHMRLLKINKNIRIYTTNMQVSPFTIGLLNPIIVMPDIPDLYKKELIIQHELHHIKSHDSIIKFFQMIVVGVFGSIH